VSDSVKTMVSMCIQQVGVPNANGDVFTEEALRKAVSKRPDVLKFRDNAMWFEWELETEAETSV